MKFEVYAKSNNKISIELAKKTVDIIKEIAGKDHIIEIVSIDKPSGHDAATANYIFYVPTVIVLDDLDMDNNEVGFLENEFQMKSGIGQSLWFKKVKDFAEDMKEEWNKRNAERVGSADGD